ncbi:AAA family ATPase [uncultured Desulfobacter sp.]|uniref:AAA family ATPase n=1 Tax=uncultured Desulfobacter sp. TaxID=240139 RepID=UPI0029F4BDDE|nr:AAA family ATPase [uncultured Desulfobacter sp.]
MKITSLSLINYRCYGKIHIDFDSDMTVLVGRNGQGKTAILDAVAVALGPYLGGFDQSKGQHFSNQDARRVPHEQEEGRVNMETLYPVRLKAIGHFLDKDLVWERSRKSLKGRTTIKESASLVQLAKDLQKAVRQGEDLTLPLLAYYGTGRLWKEKRLTEKKQAGGVESRLSGYTDCLNPESSYRAFVDWLRMETMVDYEKQLALIERGEPVEPSKQGRLLSSIQRSVNTAIKPSGWKNIRFSPSAREVVAEHPEYGVLPVSTLSDGIRNMIGLVADIAYRSVRLNPHLGNDAVQETPGIVLIDEVDMHLHPEWQQVVLRDLKHPGAFPQIQFIVTTHSPQVLSTVRKEHIRILEAGEETAPIPLARTFGETSNDVLETVMHTPFRPDLEHVRDLDDYMHLIDRGLYRGKDAKSLRQKLEKVLGSDHRDLLRADRIIRRKEILG